MYLIERFSRPRRDYCYFIDVDNNAVWWHPWGSVLHHRSLMNWIESNTDFLRVRNSRNELRILLNENDAITLSLALSDIVEFRQPETPDEKYPVKLGQ